MESLFQSYWGVCSLWREKILNISSAIAAASTRVSVFPSSNSTALFMPFQGIHEDMTDSDYGAAGVFSFSTEDPHRGAAPRTCPPGPALGQLCLLHHSLSGVLASTCKTQVSRASKNSLLKWCGASRKAPARQTLIRFKLWGKENEWASVGVTPWLSSVKTAPRILHQCLSPTEGLPSKLDLSPYHYLQNRLSQFSLQTVTYWG